MRIDRTRMEKPGWAGVPCLIVALAIAATPPARAQAVPSFAKDVAPILASNCLGCHSESTKMGSLVLENFQGLMKGGHDGVVIVPGKAEESRLFQMITGKATPAMPLNGKKLADAEIDVIRRWIDGGAKPPAPGEMTVRAAAVIPDIRPKVPVKPEIASLAWSPDGRMLAEGTYKEVRLVEPDTGKVIATLAGHEQEVRGVAFSPDGQLLAAAGGLPARDGEIKIWNVAKRSEARTIKGHQDCIYSVAFSPDGKSIASASYDKLIKLWDVATGNEIRTLKDHIDSVFALAFTPDGKHIVSAAADRSVKVWDVATGNRLYTMSEAQDGLNAIALDPTGKRVAAGGLDKTIRIWSLGEKSGTLVNSLIAHEDSILQLAWSPDGKYLISSAADRTIKVFLADDLTELKTYTVPDWVLSLRFAPDGKSFAAGSFDGTLVIYHATDFANKAPTHVAQR